MQKAHPTFSAAHRSSLRTASRAGRFAKRWHLSPASPPRPQPLNTTAPFRLKIPAGRKPC